MGKVYKGDIGIVIILDTGQDLTGATKMEIIAKKPSGRKVTWTATAYDATSITYTTITNDFGESGVYYLQAQVEWGDDSFHHGETYEMFVYPLYG